MAGTIMPPTFPIFDGHNDTLLRLFTCADPVASFQDCAGHGHLDLALARKGGLAGGLFACFVRPDGPRDAGFSLTTDGYTVEMPDPPGLSDARRMTDAMIACAHRLEAELPGQIAVCRDLAEIHRSLACDTLAMVLHLEGAEAIDQNLDGLEAYYLAGVRSIGPVWSRPNRFGIGVPFRFPGTCDLGPGLTAAGLTLVRACDELGIMLDLSHLNAAGFWDVARTSRRPLVATHSNAHAICPVPRNLLDDQLRAMRDSDGLVGVSLSVPELRPDGHNKADTPLAVVLRHIEYLLEFLGPNGVAIGSDLDGALLPAEIGDAGGLGNLVAAMLTGVTVPTFCGSFATTTGSRCSGVAGARREPRSGNHPGHAFNGPGWSRRVQAEVRLMEKSGRKRTVRSGAGWSSKQTLMSVASNLPISISDQSCALSVGSKLR